MTSRWSHLTADTAEELHDFARRLGIPARAFQHKPNKPAFDHYDVTEELRQLAIELGAVSLTWREAARMRRENALRASGRLGTPAPDSLAGGPRSPE
jgi:hypothetical protein